MTAATISANSKVLVLNKAWQAINVVTLEKAMKKLSGTYKNGEPKAKIIDCIHDFRMMTWEDWSELKPNSDYCPECHQIMGKHQIDSNGHCLVCKEQGKTTLVGEKGMRSVNAILRVPRVIQLTRFDRMPVQKVHYNRRTVYKRDGNQCQYCGCRPGTKELSIDHVVPRAQGGKTTWTNVVVACTSCNARKADRTPEQAGMRLLKEPKRPKYNLYVGDIRVKDWESFLGAAYWLTELDHDE